MTNRAFWLGGTEMQPESGHMFVFQLHTFLFYVIPFLQLLGIICIQAAEDRWTGTTQGWNVSRYWEVSGWLVQRDVFEKRHVWSLSRQLRNSCFEVRNSGKMGTEQSYISWAMFAYEYISFQVALGFPKIERDRSYGVYHSAISHTLCTCQRP